MRSFSLGSPWRRGVQGWWTQSWARWVTVGVRLILLPSSIVAGTVGAQTTTSTATQTADTMPLSLADVLTRATRTSREVRLARSQVELAGTQVTAARSQALPQIDGTLGYTRTYQTPFATTSSPTLPDSLKFSPDTLASIEDRVRYLEKHAPTAGLGALGSLFSNLPFGQANAYVAQVQANQLLYSGGRVGSALKIASRYKEAAQFTYDEQVAAIELEARTAYYRAVLAQELESIAAAAVAQAQRFLDEEQLRFKAGTTSELDVLRAEVSLANLRPQLVEARNANEIATLNLKRLIDVPLTQPVRLTTPLDVPTDTTARALTDADATRLLARRSAVLAAERQVAIKDLQVSIARGAYLPSASLQIVYGRQAYPLRTFGLSDASWLPNFTAQIGVQVPIFSGFKRQADVQQARIELDQARLQLSQLETSVQLEYEQARGERERALSSIAARQRTVEQAQRVYDLTVLRYQKGLATQLEASDARLALLQARTNLAQATADYYIADAQMAKALGRSMGQLGQ